MKEIRGFERKEDWQQLFQKAIGEDPKKRAERQWELVVYRYNFYIHPSNLDLLEKNLKEANPELIKDGVELVSFNKGKHIELECEGHAIAINSINFGLGFGSPNLGGGNGVFSDKEEKEKQKAQHRIALGRLLSEERTFKEWPGAVKWAKVIPDQLEELAKKLDEVEKNKLIEMAKTIRDNKRNFEIQTAPKRRLEDSNRLQKPANVHG
jgi:hypothetical protein